MKVADNPQARESSGAKETLDRHGEVLCVGDFNGDGFDDLATAARYEDYSNWPGSDHGAVIINFGSPEDGIEWRVCSQAEEIDAMQQSRALFDREPIPAPETPRTPD